MNPSLSDKTRVSEAASRASRDPFCQRSSQRRISLSLPLSHSLEICERRSHDGWSHARLLFAVVISRCNRDCAMMEDPRETQGAARVHVSCGRIAHLAEADSLVRATKSSEAARYCITDDNFGFGRYSTGGLSMGVNHSLRYRTYLAHVV